MPDPGNPKKRRQSGDEGALDRRDFLKVAIGALGAVYAGAVGYPVYRYLSSPVEEGAAAAAVKSVTLDNAATLPRNAALMFKFGPFPAMLIHHDDDTWTALKAVCTHLGCTPAYKPEARQIQCPCHGGVYDPRTGANIAGPPPKPLTQFQVSIDHGKVTVSRS